MVVSTYSIPQSEHSRAGRDEARLVDLEPARGPRRRRLDVVNLGHIHESRTVVCSSESDGSAALRSGLLVQLHRDTIASLPNEGQMGRRRHGGRLSP
jgi:hypothetical protein